MTVNLKIIRSFVAVAELGSFRRAGDRLRVSQPALSSHVRELEIQLGVTLFRRTTRQVRLTEQGDLFLGRIKRTLNDFDSAILETRDQATVQRGRAIVASVPSIAANVLPDVLARFIKANPGIDIQICDNRAEIIEFQVEHSEVDFAIAPKGRPNADLEFEPIVEDGYVAIIPKTHPLASRRMIKLQTLLSHHLITMRSGLNIRTVLDDAAAKCGLDLKTIHEVNHHDTLIGMVAAGLGIGAMPALTTSMIRHPSLVLAKIVEPSIERTIGILSRRGEPLSPAAQKFADAVRARLLERKRAPSRGKK